ncbi:MAG: phosphoadenosine phosphosulfate reductase family protein [Desulfonatronovibrio sp.]
MTEKIFAEIQSIAVNSCIYIAWTGGKDSTVVLYLWKNFLEQKGWKSNPGAINLDTGLKFPEIIRFRDRLARAWGIDLHVIKPDIDISGYPVAENAVDCCNDLKIIPLKTAVANLGAQALITGIRNDEHSARRSRDNIEQKLDPDYFQINPILHWNEMDIWSFIIQQGLPYCTLYDQGYSSLGCVPCTEKSTGSGERSGRNAHKEQSLDALRSLGYF